MIKSLILALFVSMGFVHVVGAADLPSRYAAPAPVFVSESRAFDFTGFYAGLNGGYSRGEFRSSNSSAGGFGLPDAQGDLRGAFGGGQAGYNVQYGRLVFGVETDLQGSRAKSGSAFPNAGGVTTEASLNWFGTTRGRVGYAFDRVLFYGTGGLAYAGIDGTSNDPAGIYTGKQGQVHFGYALGAGIEYAFADRWTVKAEYLHLDLGKKTYTVQDARSDGRYTADLARVGLNYRF